MNGRNTYYTTGGNYIISIKIGSNKMLLLDITYHILLLDVTYHINRTPNLGSACPGSRGTIFIYIFWGLYSYTYPGIYSYPVHRHIRGLYSYTYPGIGIVRAVEAVDMYSVPYSLLYHMSRTRNVCYLGSACPGSRGRGWPRETSRTTLCYTLLY